MKRANNPRIQTLARELGLTARGDSFDRIVAFAMVQARSILDGFEVRDLDTMIRLVANRLRVRIEYIRDDTDVARLAAEYDGFHSHLARQLEEEFLQGETEGVTLARDGGDAKSFRFLAIIDARGGRSARAYFTAWHELVHLLIHPPQLAFKGFRRTPPRELIQKDPVESLVDSIAGRLAFYDPIFGPALETSMHQCGGLTFDAIETARQAVAPTASMHAAMLAAVRTCGSPALCVSVEQRFKKSEAREVASPQVALALGQRQPQRQLRAATVGRNELAAEAGLEIFANMRIPTRSIIAMVSAKSHDVCTSAVEDQDWWETSDDGPLASQPIRVEAMRRGRFVYALITPSVRA